LLKKKSRQPTIHESLAPETAQVTSCSIF